MQLNFSGKSGLYFKVLKAASEYGLSFDTCGREWVMATTRSASKLPTANDSLSCHYQRE
jgi:hypothetical protein